MSLERYLAHLNTPMNVENRISVNILGEDTSFGNEVCDGAPLTGTPCVGGAVADCWGGMDFSTLCLVLFYSLTFSSLYFLFPFSHITCSPFLGKLVPRGKITGYLETTWHKHTGQCHAARCVIDFNAGLCQLGIGQYSDSTLIFRKSVLSLG